jgi:diguanylate cyclase (GGDEF)-like protein
VSPIWSSILTAAGGVLAGLALAGAVLWRQQRALARARHDATHDDTTGLPNRRALLGAMTRAVRRGRPFGVVLLDLDSFKTINDTFGHEGGNHLLTAIGRRLVDLPPPVRLAARLSGDEFALLVVGDRDAVAAAARAAWRTVGLDPVPVGDRYVPVQASVGYATAALGVDPRTLLRQADLAMYHAKQTGSGVHGTASTAHTDLPPGTRCRDQRRRN